MAQTYSNAVVGLNPAGYWPLNETAQPPQALNMTAQNLGLLGSEGNGFYGAWYQPSGNTWYITNSAATTPGITADGDTALNNTYGAGQYIVIPRDTNGVPDSALTISPPFSVEAWVQVKTNASRLGYIVCEGQVPLSIGGPDTNNPFYGGPATAWAGFQVAQYANYFVFDCFETNGTSKGNELDSPKNLTIGQWVHLVVTYDGATETMYENGAQVSQKTVAANAAGLKYVPDPTSPLMIGSGSDVSVDNGAVAHTGPIDEVAIYTNLLSPASIMTHYQTAYGTNATYGTNYPAAVLADSPLIYFRMDDAPGAQNAGYPSGAFPTATNYGSLGTSADGVYQPGTTPGVAGPNFPGFGGDSRSVAINGWFGAVDVGSSNLPAALNPTGAVPMTVVSWFKTGPADAPGRLQNILGHGDNSYRMTLGQIDAETHFNPGPGPELQFSNAPDMITNYFALNDGRWHMIAGVSDGTNEFLYLDGVLAKTNSNPTGINIAGNTTDLLLGGDPQHTAASFNTANTIRNFNGDIAQVAFWTNALSSTDIQSLFSAAGVAPYFAVQPQSATNNAGVVVTILAGVRGSSPVYQWYQDGTAIPAQTNENLNLNPAQASDSGNYYLVATNSFGAVTSSVVSVVIYGPPTVLEQTPAQLEIFSGSSPTLHVTASGAQPLSYQWTLNGSPIPDATNSSYTATDVQASGAYGCLIANSISTTPITPISLTVLSAPTAPYPQQVLADNPVAYFRLDESSGPVAYDYVGGNNGGYTNVMLGVPGYNSTAPVQSDPAETAAEFGDYPPDNNYVGNVPTYLNFGVTNGGNAEFSVEAWVTKYLYRNGNGIVALGYGNGGEQFVLDTGNGSGGGLRFLVRNAAGATSSASVTNTLANDALWHHVVGVCDEAGGHLYLYLDGVQVASGTIAANSGLLNSITPLSIGARQSGNSNPPDYDYQFIGAVDDVSLYNYALSPAQISNHYNAAGVKPSITAVQPSNQVSGDAGQDVTLSVTVNGTSPFSYQWYDNNNNPIQDATNAALTLTNLQTSQEGNYQVIVSNPYGSATTNAYVSVGSGAPVISVDLQPLNVTAYVGSTDAFSVSVSGSAPFYYQWYENGAPIAGQTNRAYSFVVPAGTNSYYVSVTNSLSAGTPTVSSTATVAGILLPVLDPASFSSKLKITFIGYNRSETLRDFPALVELGSNVMGFSYSQFASTNGTDLRFTDSTGTNEIPYEVNQWNTNGVSTFWVQVPALSGTNDYIMAYWGNTVDTLAPDFTTNGLVWVPPTAGSEPAYEAVYHLEESGFPYLDSTLQYPAATGLAPALTNGLVGNGQSFNRLPYLDAGAITLSNTFTLSAWVNPSTTINDIEGVWGNGPGGYSSPGIRFYVNTYQTSDGALILATGNGSAGTQLTTGPGAVTLGQWHYVTATVDHNAGIASLYVDGQFKTSGATRTDFPLNTDMNLARFPDGSYALQGMMDEARIRAGLSSTNWIWASYMTVAQNGAFESYSSINGSSVALTIEHQGNNIILTWPEGALQSADSVTGPYSNVAGATSPYTNTISADTQFYRVQVK